ncbi:hypothetical protein F3Y22_tig00110162pilonHSYRG00036 [Hibiscus syriacus]|uniref:Uncharacterized protein n=1 Tax=Hibiscus syriacus TaxID=106335 RepID=A0A6A3BI86_HIBSY|nr:hypothetical protein F3Y22_tig00110162pilonHSYRG00036 [Hibiscus syriacus]
MDKILPTSMDCKLTRKILFDQVENPTGIIQMGLAENQLSLDLVESWLRKNPDAMELNKDGVLRKTAIG